MSLKISGLTKVFGTQKAVNDISFSVNAGEIVGFLGPNGAGKSTTMKIATTYLAPSSGHVSVAGFDVIDHPHAVKRSLGYLPEHNPLYLDMYVREYLEFVGKLYNLGSRLKKKVDEMVERCGLTNEQGKKIEALSKGYRQRVGIAQALIHDPAVLILDEPTTGLDPNQIIEIRRLIREVSVNKTVLFSTHIMQEVQALCDRVVLINKGSIIADDSLTSLLNRNQQYAFIAEFDHTVDRSLFDGIGSVTSATLVGVNQYRIVAGKDIRADIFRLAAEKNLGMLGLKQESASLESIFQELTR